jgi:TolB protein
VRLLLTTALALLAFAAPADAAFPGANGKIAFYSNRDGTTQIYVMNSDGSGVAKLTNSPGENSYPAWSPDGQRIVFESTRDDPNPAGCTSCKHELYVMNADGTSQVRLTNSPDYNSHPTWSPDGKRIAWLSVPCTGCQQIHVMNADGSGQVTIADGFDPAWSPDGQKIAFASRFWDIYSMNPDGTGQVDLTNSPNWYERAPDWSPDRRKITYQLDQCGTCTFDTLMWGVATMNADGTAQTQVNFNGVDPVWSPDGTRIAFAQFGHCGVACSSKDLVTMNPDGSGVTTLTNSPAGQFSTSPAWQPIPFTGYPRPRGATPFRTSLVPAYRQCTAPNDTHGAPLSFGSCNPPQQASNFLTVGTPDANGAAANSTGYLRLDVIPHYCCPPQDLRITGTITDVRCRASMGGCGSANTTGGADYIGQLRMNTTIRITDHNSGPNVDEPATVVDIPFPVNMDCFGTSDPSIGSSCSVASSAVAVVPQASTPARAVVEIGQVKVYDGGANGVAGSSDATLFMDEGVFVP